MSEAFQCDRCMSYHDIDDKGMRLGDTYDFCKSCAKSFNEWLGQGTPKAVIKGKDPH